MSKYNLMIAFSLILTLTAIGLWIWDAFVEKDGEVQYFSLFAGLAGLFALISAIRNKSHNK